MNASSPPAGGGWSSAHGLMAGGAVVVLLGLMLPQLVLPSTAPSDGPGPLAVVARLVIGLAVVGGACVAVARLTTRPAPPVGRMRLLAGLPLDGRCTVYLVHAGDHRILIGSDAGGVKSVVELPGTTPEPIAPPTAPATASVLGPFRVPAAPPPASRPPAAPEAITPESVAAEVEALLATMRHTPTPTA